MDDQRQPASGLVITAAVTVGILIAVFVLYAVISGARGANEYDCVMDNADRVIAGQAEKDC